MIGIFYSFIYREFAQVFLLAKSTQENKAHLQQYRKLLDVVPLMNDGYCQIDIKLENKGESSSKIDFPRDRIRIYKTGTHVKISCIFFNI